MNDCSFLRSDRLDYSLQVHIKTRVHISWLNCFHCHSSSLICMLPLPTSALAVPSCVPTGTDTESKEGTIARSSILTGCTAVCKYVHAYETYNHVSFMAYNNVYVACSYTSALAVGWLVPTGTDAERNRRCSKTRSSILTGWKTVCNMKHEGEVIK